MSYTLIRRCESCDQTFRARCTPGDPWPATCSACSPNRTGTAKRKSQPTKAMRKGR